MPNGGALLVKFRLGIFRCRISLPVNPPSFRQLIGLAPPLPICLPRPAIIRPRSLRMATSSLRRWPSPDCVEASRRFSGRLSFVQLEDRCTPATAYLATDLVADLPGIAPVTDPTLVNAWGIALNPNGPFWVSANGTDLSQVYVGTNPVNAAFRVTIPSGAPTGQVFNNSGSTADFPVTDGSATAASVFIFASEAGVVSGWAPTVGGGGPLRPAEVGFTAPDGAIYKGIAIGKNGTQNLLYLTDFHNGKIDVLNGTWQKVTLGT